MTTNRSLTLHWLEDLAPAFRVAGAALKVSGAVGKAVIEKALQEAAEVAAKKAAKRASEDSVREAPERGGLRGRQVGSEESRHRRSQEGE